jgi:hypothetical protein
MCESQDPADDSQRTAIVNTSERTLTIADADGRTEVEPIIGYKVSSGIYVNRFGTEKSRPMLYNVVTSPTNCSRPASTLRAAICSHTNVAPCSTRARRCTTTALHSDP